MYPYHRFNHSDATMNTNQFSTMSFYFEFSCVFKPLCSVCSKIKYEVTFPLCNMLVRHATESEECLSCFTQIFCNVKTVCDATNQTFLTCHFVDALQSPYRDLRYNKININERVSCHLSADLNKIWVWNWNDFSKYCDTFIDTRRRQVFYGPLRKISMFWIALPMSLCFNHFICISWIIKRTPYMFIPNTYFADLATQRFGHEMLRRN